MIPHMSASWPPQSQPLSYRSKVLENSKSPAFARTPLCLAPREGSAELTLDKRCDPSTALLRIGPAAGLDEHPDEGFCARGPHEHAPLAAEPFTQPLDRAKQGGSELLGADGYVRDGLGIAL